MAASIKVFKPGVSNELYIKLLSCFPGKINFGFAYGSGAIAQQGNGNVKENMLDLVFVVDDPLRWHRENLETNKSHYSFLRFGGAKLVNTVQGKYGAGVYYNTLVPYENGLLKYGVISTKKFVTDLLDWDTLYISGRLHKPVEVVKSSKSNEVLKALYINLQSAVHVSLLNLPGSFTEEEFYLKVAGLSYAGDFRMLFGEDKHKVQKIVSAQVPRFRTIYQPILRNVPGIYWQENTGMIEQDLSVYSRLHHLNLLPRAIQHKLLMSWNKDGRYRDMEDVLKAIAHEQDCGDHVTSAVCDVVWRSSWSQSIKGILTAGLLKSVKYSGKKVLKMVKGMKKNSQKL